MIKVEDNKIELEESFEEESFEETYQEKVLRLIKKPEVYIPAITATLLVVSSVAIILVKWDGITKTFTNIATLSRIARRYTSLLKEQQDKLNKFLKAHYTLAKKEGASQKSRLVLAKHKSNSIVNDSGAGSDDNANPEGTNEKVILKTNQDKKE